MEHHHMHHNPPLHWGYSSTPTHLAHNTWVPPPSRPLKRSISESDCDDNFSETSSKGQSPKDVGTDSCQQMSRKKRRGVIEKRRRDRINLSLLELKKLVPTAAEKQGSAKLEKAEILQLTVDHLKSLQSKGPFDAHGFAMNYQISGIRECATEVARYLNSHEGMNIENPLRMRLMSHLQGFVTQQEITIKSTQGPVSGSPSPSWSPHHASYHSLPHHQGTYATAVPPPLPPAPMHVTSVTSHHPGMYHHQSGYATSQLTNSNGYSYVPNLPTAIATTSVGSILSDPSTSTSTTSTIQSDGSLLTEHSQQQHVQQHHQHYSHHEDQNGQTYIDLSSNIHRNTAASIGYGNPHYPTASAQGYGSNIGSSVDNGTSASTYNNNNKPYRPWGTGPEMAY